MQSANRGSEVHNKRRGTLERILFFNEENQYCVGEFRDEGNQEKYIITGNLPGVQCGETLEIYGDWKTHPHHGRQFKVVEFTSKLPSTLYGIRKYLGSGLVTGIGKTYAEKIVNHFKTDTLKVISEESGRLKEVPGIGAQRAKAIKKAWDDQKAVRDVFMFLKQYGVGTSQCLRLVKNYGNTASEVLKSDPYKVAYEIKGIGFKTADKIALNLGFGSESPERLRAGIQFALKEMEGEGHTCAPREYLEQASVELLDCDIERVREQMEALILSSTLVPLPYDDLIQLPYLEKAEKSITQSIGLIYHGESSLPGILVDKAVDWAQGRAGFEFAEQQMEAIKTALSSKISVLTGGPGTGKTTILRAIVDILRAKKVRITLAAPTGRAAQRMSQAARHYAQTIHRLLKTDPEKKGTFAFNETNPLKTDFVIVDEASMIDTSLAASLLRAVPNEAHVLFVGDINQLPSVGPGSVLKDIIQTGEIPTVALNKIFRQGKRSQIVTTAHNILEGKPFCAKVSENPSEIDKKADLNFIRALEPELSIKYIKDLVRHGKTDESALMNTQILAPMHKGIAGIGNINFELQKELNAEGKGIALGPLQFKEGDKVIQTRNNYEKNIFNGDLGRILKVNAQQQTITVDFDGQEVELERFEMPDITHAYAISIHKSQGSEFPTVIIPLLKQHFVMLQRNLIYTAITRGRRRVIIVGDPTAYVMAVGNDKSTVRFTGLRHQLAAILGLPVGVTAT